MLIFHQMVQVIFTAFNSPPDFFLSLWMTIQSENQQHDLQETPDFNFKKTGKDKGREGM